MSKKIFVFLSLLVVASMLLVACGGGATEEPVATEPPAVEEPTAVPEEPTAVPEEPTAVPPTEAPAEATCEDAIGCVEVAAGDPIHIAYAMVIAGPDATLGTDSRNGAEIAISDKGGTLLGHPIQFDGE
ncbi:MAG: putative Branched-chain amino acid transporter, periplasmic amino acid-binding protein, partial [Chloroflexi bacterium]|nr:putative Branched-chain amino acid transporter, periplasmic amino acid-binding protein [Chloroflexota bacterium]